MITIGVVGPRESVEKILIVAEEFDNIHCQPYIYDDVSDMETILKTQKRPVHQWLFTGIMNHSYAIQNKLVTHNNSYFPLLHGSSFFGSLLGIQQEQGKLFQSISIDTITDEEIEKVISFYNIDNLDFISTPYTDYQRIDELVDFHHKLYKEGKAEVAITAIRSVYEQLLELNVPTYRLTPSYLSIKLTIQVLIEKAQAHMYENLRLAVIGCKVFNTTDFSENSIFNWKKQELKFKQHLFDLTEKLNGSIIEPQDGLYYIFTTKGEINERIEKKLFEHINFHQLEHDLQIGFCIGYGSTVFQAEQNVRFGLQELRYGKTPAILVVKNKHHITQLTQGEDEETTRTNAIIKYFEKRLQGTTVNPRDVSRIILFTHQYNKFQFTADDVTNWIQGTKRNARRILKILTEHHIVQVVDKVSDKGRGRPSNVYEFISKDMD